MASHQKWCVSKQVSVGVGRGNEDSFKDDCAFCFSSVECDKGMPIWVYFSVVPFRHPLKVCKLSRTLVHANSKSEGNIVIDAPVSCKMSIC